MKHVHVDTSNVRNFLAAIRRVEGRGAPEACLIVVDGEPGLGKTTSVNHWAVQTLGLYTRAQVGWDYDWFIKELLKELGIHAPRGRSARFDRLVAELAVRYAEAQALGRSFGLVIDEADLISTRREIMEAIRGISDVVQMPTILVGMGRLRENLRRFPQIESRAPQKVEFKPASLEDVATLVAARSEVKVAPCLLEAVHRLSRGLNREIMDAISHIERFGLRMDPGALGVTLEDMQGQVLMSDRRTGAPVLAPRVL